ncbi:ribonuclease HIII [Eupransor demetentiae]|uniref:Ribonuclease HIII n=1 Tax=Eupransor demetentiae TaxID=3109584 RepID=A0ABP0ES13_9LACO|nr:Ribonuclease HIII (RnhC) [Lactobacillaceae bacterium LMG 33000]
MQTVIKVSSDTMQKLAQHYGAQLGSATAPGTLFSCKSKGLTITGYRSGKVMFQGQYSEKEAARWGTASHSGTHKKSTGKSGTLPAGFASWSAIGSDEVGAGAYFGPLTTAAVYVAKENLDWVRSLGIADSKTLTDEKMRAIAPEIITKLPHHVVNLMPPKYNELQKKYNVVALKALSHNFVLNAVLQKIAPVKPDGILIDQFAQASTYFRYLEKARQNPIIRQNVYFSTKGEQHHLSVAAASVLARVIELDSMKDLSEKAGCTLPIGAGKEVDRVAARLLSQGVNLGDFAKLHFANTQKAEKLL